MGIWELLAPSKKKNKTVDLELHYSFPEQTRKLTAPLVHHPEWREGERSLTVGRMLEA